MIKGRYSSRKASVESTQVVHHLCLRAHDMTCPSHPVLRAMTTAPTSTSASSSRRRTPESGFKWSFEWKSGASSSHLSSTARPHTRSSTHHEAARDCHSLCMATVGCVVQISGPTRKPAPRRESTPTQGHRTIRNGESSCIIWVSFVLPGLRRMRQIQRMREVVAESRKCSSGRALFLERVRPVSRQRCPPSIAGCSGLNVCVC
ncbi:hypothetical protein B0T11DRAFT_2858 [Plectosphaerella cucumerina]|uniref:Uncharacterized protein n=1 Tax=Plectosphaerella cucumerina TaxID=40658 RepID=A0A8K0X7W5_9PEZI|nr:hypothetical protein B0T11DRAFT_2858 [Plectosphaerella cucumerina]